MAEVRKNVMIVDGALNCAYDIFSVSDRDFCLLFPADGQDIAFSDEIAAALPARLLKQVYSRLWSHPAPKVEMIGLHGTIFFELGEKKDFYPNRRDSDLTANGGRARPVKDETNG